MNRLIVVLAQAGGGNTSGGRVSYTPDWSLFSSAQHLVQQGLNLLAALGLACCAGFFIWGAILAAGGVSSQIPHNVAAASIRCSSRPCAPWVWGSARW